MRAVIESPIWSRAHEECAVSFSFCVCRHCTPHTCTHMPWTYSSQSLFFYHMVISKWYKPFWIRPIYSSFLYFTIYIITWISNEIPYSVCRKPQSSWTQQSHWVQWLANPNEATLSFPVSHLQNWLTYSPYNCSWTGRHLLFTSLPLKVIFWIFASALLVFSVKFSPQGRITWISSGQTLYESMAMFSLALSHIIPTSTFISHHSNDLSLPEQYTMWQNH